jgi:hypothetical protein
MRSLLIEDDPVLLNGLTTGLSLHSTDQHQKPIADRALARPPIDGSCPHRGFTRHQGWRLRDRQICRNSSERRLSCQIWSFDGEHFRVYAIEDAARGVRVLVGDDRGQRQNPAGSWR